jgi:hypothetical protein
MTLRAAGALRQNDALDRAIVLAECPAPDNLLWQDDHLLLTSGKRVLLLDGLDQEGAELEEILHFESEVSALAAAEDGSLAVALGAAGIVIVGGAHDGKVIASLGGKALIAPTALGFAGADTLFVCLGADLSPGDGWQGTTGSVWRVSLSGGPSVCLASDLAYPSGLLLHDGRIAVAESGRKRLLDFSTLERETPRVLLDDLPGHPGRLSAAPGGGAWLAVFAPPSPWRPFGMALGLDRDFAPLRALHSRMDAKRDGVASCLEIRGELIVACKGGNVVVAAELAGSSTD